MVDKWETQMCELRIGDIRIKQINLINRWREIWYRNPKANWNIERCLPEINQITMQWGIFVRIEEHSIAISYIWSLILNNFFTAEEETWNEILFCTRMLIISMTEHASNDRDTGTFWNMREKVLENMTFTGLKESEVGKQRLTDWTNLWELMSKYGQWVMKKIRILLRARIDRK